MSQPSSSRRRAPQVPAALIDSAAVRADLAAIAKKHGGDDSALRMALVARLKSALAEGRALAERQLLEDGSGRDCAEGLSALMDSIIALLYEIAAGSLYRSDNPSSSERMAVVAVGGYGRGLLAPGSDIDLLFLLPYKQTAWGESVAEAILYPLWDMGLKVGHATRSVDECIRQARADMTIRTTILEARHIIGDTALTGELAQRFDADIVQGTAVDFIAAKLAEREDRHKRSGESRYLVEPNVKDGKGGLRDLHTLFWIAKYVYRVAPLRSWSKKVFSPDRKHRRFAGRKTSSGPCVAICISSPAAPKSVSPSTCNVKWPSGLDIPSIPA
jgi:[protein-PII] uridylyltransferase